MGQGVVTNSLNVFNFLRNPCREFGNGQYLLIVVNSGLLVTMMHYHTRNLVSIPAKTCMSITGDVRKSDCFNAQNVPHCTIRHVWGLTQAVHNVKMCHHRTARPVLTVYLQQQNDRYYMATFSNAYTHHISTLHNILYKTLLHSNIIGCTVSYIPLLIKANNCLLHIDL